jgi:hypothetical protein
MSSLRSGALHFYANLPILITSSFIQRIIPLGERGPPTMDWSGQLFLWEGRGLYVGPTYRTTSHAHHAVQICVALQGRLRLRTAVKTRWRAYRAAVVPADLQHELDAGGG